MLLLLLLVLVVSFNGKGQTGRSVDEGVCFVFGVVVGGAVV